MHAMRPNNNLIYNAQCPENLESKALCSCQVDRQSSYFTIHSNFAQNGTITYQKPGGPQCIVVEGNKRTVYLAAGVYHSQLIVIINIAMTFVTRLLHAGITCVNMATDKRQIV